MKKLFKVQTADKMMWVVCNNIADIVQKFPDALFINLITNNVTENDEYLVILN